MEEFSEGHKDMMEPPNTRKPPERCPRPLYSRDSTQEDHTIPHHHQSGNLGDDNVVKEEYKEEDEEYGVMEEFLEGHKDMMESPNTRNPPERCPRPLYSWDSTQEDQYYEDKEHFSKIEENGKISQRSSLSHQSYKEEGLPEISTDSRAVKTYLCSECGQSFKRKDHLRRHMRIHTGENFPCEECGKCFMRKDKLTSHLRIHTGEKLPTCTECGKCFSHKESLVKHLKIHTGEKPFSCPDCGKHFSQKNNLWNHQKLHLDTSSLSFLECGKPFIITTEPTIHQGGHTKKLFPCSECGKLSISKSHLIVHQRSHTECGKTYVENADLLKHLRSHTGERPFPCSMCGKCFARKSSLVKHQSRHTGGRPDSNKS
ncbi:hypothetical protein AB205_0082870, partial [Aquarana catesbeiana]